MKDIKAMATNTFDTAGIIYFKSLLQEKLRV